jgi:hypothetical protein
MAQYAFGSGVLYGRNTTANSTPVRFGGMQGVTLDFAFSIKELYGQYQFPIALGRGVGKITGKSTWAQFNAEAFNSIFFGQSTPATGEYKTAVAEQATVTANIVTASHNGAGVFFADYGVVLASDGSVYTKVASAPVGQQYTCNETTGVYTFNTSQNNSVVQVSYVWKDAANGKLITISNQLLGNAPEFSAVFTETFQGKQMTFVLNKCMSNKLAMASKLEDFMIPEFDFSAFADSSQTIGTISMEE